MPLRLLAPVAAFFAALLLAAGCAGPSRRAVDTSTLAGKVMCGYQGWFNAEGDGADRGYTHWSRGGVRPGPRTIRVDLWPDVSELGPDERFPTDLFHPDGTRAEVFSSFRRATVVRHFRWMEENGIDGVFVQRFVQPLGRPAALAHADAVERKRPLRARNLRRPRARRRRARPLPRRRPAPRPRLRADV